MKGWSVLAAVVLGATAVVPTGGANFDFRHDVLPFLQRQGCASAYCHGGGTGQAGFKLSLFGGDPRADFGAVAVELGARRVDVEAPDQSLLVQKGLGRLEHGGGRRLPRGGAAHRALLAWIADGAVWQRGGGRELVDLNLERDGDLLRARATFDRLGDEDVSDRALFSSSDPLVLEVDEHGRLQRRGPGTAWAIARFGNATARLRVVYAFEGGARAATASASATHALDVAWLADLDELGLSPAPAAAPQRLARRLYLDLLGRPPTPSELDRFVAAPDSAATVRSLAARAEFADVWAEHVARWLEVPEDDRATTQRLAAALAGSGSLRELAAEVARGELVPLRRLHPDPRDRAEHVGRTLLGLRIGCARCHDHPGDTWRRDEYEAFSAAFAAQPGDGSGMAVGQVFDPDTGEAVVPRWLGLAGATVAAQPAGADTLAAFVLDDGHGRLARHFANHVFAELFGKGLVEPRDDHRAGNPARSERVLAAVAAEFDRVGGDLVALLTFVATSRLYGLQSAADAAGNRWLASRAVVPLDAAAFARATSAIVGRELRGVPDEPLARELALRNGPGLRRLLDGRGSTVDALFELGTTPGERLHELWRTLLSRAPLPAEVDEFAAFAGEREAFRDLAAAVLTGREFSERR